MPKEMLPLVDTPAIHYVVKEALDAGIDDIIIITGRGKRAVEDYFDESPELAMHLKKKQKHSLIDFIDEISIWQTFITSVRKIQKDFLILL